MLGSVTAPAQTANVLERTYLTGAWKHTDRAIGTASYRLPTWATVEAAAALCDRVPGFHDSRDGGVLRRFGLTIAPGVLRIRSVARGIEAADVGKSWLEGLAGEGPSTPEAWETGRRSAPLPLTSYDRTQPLRKGNAGGTKKSVTEWSRKSRLNMARVLASLDWAGHLEDAPAGWRPQMVTLTLPRDWEAVAPDGQAFKRLFEVWLKRYERKWGRGWAGTWKLEFQGRGAPHLHLYGNLPCGLALKRWLSCSWSAVVFGIELEPPDNDWTGYVEAVRVYHGDRVGDHLEAGTGVDWREGVRGTDPRSIALYFLGKSVGHNLGLGKEYQHRVPELWQQPGKGAGRFWGYRGLSKVEATRELDDVMFVRLRRLTRRWSCGQGERCCVDQRLVRREAFGPAGRATGKLVCEACGSETPRRGRKRIRATGFSRYQGFTLLHADAPRWLSQALRWDLLAAGDVWDGTMRWGPGPGRLP